MKTFVQWMRERGATKRPPLFGHHYPPNGHKLCAMLRITGDDLEARKEIKRLHALWRQERKAEETTVNHQETAGVM